ncbi:MAG: inositol monophosphatase family protein [Paracoccaceae bacterium]
MTDDAFGGRYAFALDLIRAAGDLALGYFRQRDSLTIQSKGLQDMASEADVNTELLIRRALEERFPQDAFLGEETGMTDYAADQGIWVVDPIDGTQPFISGMSAWCVSIAYMQGGELRFGMVYAPARGELFAGGQGIPAMLNGKPLAPHPGKTIRDGLCCVGHAPRVAPDAFLPIFERFIRAGGMYFREGSGALALCYVASGQLLGYVEAHINSWDCLGGIAVCHAAGLKTNDFLSGEGLHKGNPIVAGNAAIYAELDAILRG